MQWVQVVTHCWIEAVQDQKRELRGETRKNHLLCPFCRTPDTSSNAQILRRVRKRAEADDAEAMYQLGIKYFRGYNGLP